MLEDKVKKSLKILIGFLKTDICIFEYKNIHKWQIQI
jgi:hypothetical protein